MGATRRLLLRIAGVISLGYFVLHLFFWKMLDWSEELPRLSQDNSGVMQLLNIVTIHVFLVGGVIAIHLAGSKELTPAERGFLFLMAGIYVLRIGLGYPFFGLDAVEVVIWITCAVAAAGHLLAMKR